MSPKSQRQRSSIVEPLDNEIVSLAVQSQPTAWVDPTFTGMPFCLLDIERREFHSPPSQGLDRAIRVVIDGRVENLPSVEITIRGYIRPTASETKPERRT